MKELTNIQAELKAPKGQFNKFGGYKYRSTEDILEAVKPLLKKEGCTLTLTDVVTLVGDRYYVVANATITNAKGDTVMATGWAREATTKKGMDESQITGSASSYARKYALGGLFAIDDTKDADATNTGADEPKPKTEPKAVTLDTVKGWLAKAKKESDLMAIYKSVPGELVQQVLPLLTERKKELKGGEA